MRTTRLRCALTVTAVCVALALAVSGCGPIQDLFGGDSEPERDETTGEVTETVEGASVFDLQEGDCIGDFAADEEGGIEEVDIFPCASEYQQQVFLITQIEGEELPDQEGVEEVVIAECLPAFEEYIGVAYEESELEINYLAPSPDTWETGDRDVVCTVLDPLGSVTGSLEGADR